MNARVQLGSAHTVAPVRLRYARCAQLLTSLRTSRVNVCEHCVICGFNPVPVHDPRRVWEQIFIRNGLRRRFMTF